MRKMTKVLRTLVKLRRERMTQAELARRMKISRQQANSIESGRAGDPSARTLERYAKAIHVRLVVESLD